MDPKFFVDLISLDVLLPSNACHVLFSSSTEDGEIIAKFNRALASITTDG